MPGPSISFDQHLINGLRPYSDMPLDSPFMQKMRNIMATERRGKQLPTFNWPVGFQALHGTFPHAELFYDDRVALALINSVLYTVNPSALTTSAITTYDAEDASTTRALDASTGPLQVAAFLDVYFGSNGANIFYKIPATTSNRVVCADETIFKSVANWNNRPVFVGVSGEATTNASFVAAVNKWKKRQKSNVVTSEDDDFDTSWIILGPPVLGESDVPASGMMALLGYPSETFYYDKYEPIVIEWIEQGLIDFLPMRFTGAGVGAKQQGNDLIVYGLEGVSRVTMTEQGPVETRVLDTGIPATGCYAGDVKEHVFVSKHNEMFFIGERGQTFPEAKFIGNGCYRLGYAEYLSTLTLTSARMTMDPTERYFWICDSDEAFMLSRTGLSNPKGLFPVSVIRTPGFAGMVGSTVSAGDDDVEIQLHPFSMSSREAFEILWWNMRTTDTASTAADRWKVTPIAKLHKHNSMTTFTSFAKLFDVRGRAEVSTTGIEHAHKFTAVDRTKVDCDGLEAVLSEPGAAPSMRMWIDA